MFLSCYITCYVYVMLYKHVVMLMLHNMLCYTFMFHNILCCYITCYVINMLCLCYITFFMLCYVLKYVMVM